MKTKYFKTTILVSLISLFFLQCSLRKRSSFEAPLLEGLGSYAIDITTSSADAELFFNQGVIMANAFNHAEAARSFREVVRLDSTCAMAYWGLAYVLGPNYNTNSNLGEQMEILKAVELARYYSVDAQPWEQALIDAITAKFPLRSNTIDENKYAEAMRLAYEQFPDNDFVVTLFAESLMNLHAWDLYTKKGGEPRPWTPEIVTVLEKAMQLNPDNPLANHLYIHAVEAASDVEKGLASADRLKRLVPGAGHLVHMPSHIYINTGDYHEGSEANEVAVRADSAYIAQCKATGVYPQLYYPHNYHFLAATAALEGRGARAIEASFKMAEIIDRTYVRQEGFETTQHYLTIPYNVLVKFAQWEKIIALPMPDQDLKYPLAMWHFAQGMAFANTEKLSRAKQSLDSLTRLANTGEVKNMPIWEINFAGDVTAIAVHELSAEISVKEGNYPEAIAHLKEAIVIEDNLNYNEPPDWFFSVRHVLGDLYMHSGDYVSAEQMYREDLETFPRNGFALKGLYHSLELQDRTQEARAVKDQLFAAWKHADVELQFSRIHPGKRKDLAVFLREDTPTDLLAIAGTACMIVK